MHHFPNYLITETFPPWNIHLMGLIFWEIHLDTLLASGLHAVSKLRAKTVYLTSLFSSTHPSPEYFYLIIIAVMVLSPLPGIIRNKWQCWIHSFRGWKPTIAGNVLLLRLVWKLLSYTDFGRNSPKYQAQEKLCWHVFDYGPGPGKPSLDHVFVFVPFLVKVNSSLICSPFFKKNFKNIFMYMSVLLACV